MAPDIPPNQAGSISVASSATMTTRRPALIAKAVLSSNAPLSAGGAQPTRSRPSDFASDRLGWWRR